MTNQFNNTSNHLQQNNCCWKKANQIWNEKKSFFKVWKFTTYIDHLHLYMVEIKFSQIEQISIEIFLYTVIVIIVAIKTKKKKQTFRSKIWAKK